MLDKRFLKTALINLILFSIFFLLAAQLVSRHYQVANTEILSNFVIDLFPEPNVNGFYNNSLYPYSILTWALIGLYIFLKLGQYITGKFLTPQSRIRQSFLDCQIDLTYHLLGLLIVITLLQTWGHSKYFKNIWGKYDRLSADKIKEQLIGLSFPFAELAKEYYIPGHQNGRLITDIDINKNPGSTIYRRLAYCLYPIIIRYNQTPPDPDYLIYFVVKDAASHVPEDYKIQLDLGHSVIAVRKELL
ncbi:MAG: hypothetical protein K8S27_14825 [Candidatus Omnitrophica bacterium]|nr:hypothetical protein [Candidatus Omnitrophota bacterium]